MTQLVKKMDSIFDLGYQDQIMQLYISMSEENNNTLGIKDLGLNIYSTRTGLTIYAKPT